LYLVVYDGDIRVTLRDHGGIPVELVLFGKQRLQSVFEGVESLLNILPGCALDVLNSNGTKINLLLSIDEHVKLSSLDPGGFLGLLVLDLYPMNVDILLKRVNARLILAILNPAMLQLLCKVLSQLLDGK
jgi:hypothetical protein